MLNLETLESRVREIEARLQAEQDEQELQERLELQQRFNAEQSQFQKELDLLISRELQQQLAVGVIPCDSDLSRWAVRAQFELPGLRFKLFYGKASYDDYQRRTWRLNAVEMADEEDKFSTSTILYEAGDDAFLLEVHKLLKQWKEEQRRRQGQEEQQQSDRSAPFILDGRRSSPQIVQIIKPRSIDQ